MTEICDSTLFWASVAAEEAKNAAAAAAKKAETLSTLSSKFGVDHRAIEKHPHSYPA